MFKRILKRGAKAAKTAKEMGKGLILGAPGVGHGVAEYEDFERIRAEAARLDRVEGVTADDGNDLEAISAGTREISAEDLRILLEVEQPEDHPILLDVRQPREWAEGHLPRAVHIPLGALDDRLGELDLDRAIVTYCASGMRSIDASYVLKRHGVTDVRSLAGGIHAWQRAGSPVEQD
ncbi:MAG: hypothetical protein KDA24_00045 [Deltaproteobacteria bacterium]|nr:hypothetical protein [Deltaproteobacteria bacterium]